jgi:hydrogenase nickel incorporation protein HypA/HybF
MHEWALAESIFAAATETAAKEKLNKISEVTINLGVLQNIDRPILRFALKTLATEHPSFSTTKFIFKTQPTTLSCQACHHTWKPNLKKTLNTDQQEMIHFLPEASLAYIRCPHCGSPDFTIQTGRGVTIATIKGD